MDSEPGDNSSTPPENPTAFARVKPGRLFVVAGPLMAGRRAGFSSDFDAESSPLPSVGVNLPILKYLLPHKA